MGRDVTHDERTMRKRMATVALWAAFLTSLAVIAVVLLVAVLALTFLGAWKFAATVPVLVASGAGAWWWRSRKRRSPDSVLAAGAVVVAIGMTLLFFPVWRSQAIHDAHLADMVDVLCRYRPPAGASLDRCTGSITNTGNGNSCQYLARATIHLTTPPDPVIAHLEEQGFVETSLDIWGEPILDGLTYWRPSDSYVEVSLMESNRPRDDDLRCT